MALGLTQPLTELNIGSKRKVSQTFYNNPQGSRPPPKKNRWWNCAQININRCKIRNWKERPKKTGRRSAFYCSAMEEEALEEEEEEEEEEK